MTRKQLEDLGLTKEQADSVMKINGDDIENAKGTASTEIKNLQTEVEGLKTQVGDRDKQLETLKASAGDNADLKKKIFAAGEKTFERVWELPLYDEYDKLMKSEIADIKNAGPARQAGTIMGGIFLKKFVQDKYPWAHLDIASVAMGLGESTEDYHTPGATGYGVRLFVELLKQYSH